MTRGRFILTGAIIMGCMHVVHAAVQDHDFVETLNSQLNRVMAGAGMAVGYTDVSFVSDPMLDDYYSFKAPYLRQEAGDLTYEWRARKVGLRDLGDGKWSLMPVGTLQLRVFPTGTDTRGDVYEIRSRGMPKMTFNISDSGDIKLYKADWPESTWLDVTRKLDGDDLKARLTYEHEMKKAHWESLPNSFDRAPGEALAIQICESVNIKIADEYPDYEMNGCSWRKK